MGGKRATGGLRSRLRIVEMHPAALVVVSFSLLIVLGALCLLSPWAARGPGISVIDALFTATSAVCVTGLAVVDTGSCFTIFGQAVILALIQIGGLGVMTVSVMLFMVMGRSVGFRQRMAMQDVFAHTPRQDILDVLKTVACFTFLVEAAGFVALFLRWSAEMPAPQAAFYSLFHSVSAFCNAGFALFPDSLMRYGNDYSLNGAICALIILGGIGFPVVHDMVSQIMERKKRRTRFSLQSKIVLITTFFLLVAGTVLYWFLEHGHSLAGKPAGQSLLISFFQSVSCRTAGFNTVDIAALNSSTLTMMLALMFIGASPGSCGGGVKTTTLALIVVFTWSRVMRRKRVTLLKKSVPLETVGRSLSLTLTAVALIGIAFFLILVGDTLSATAAEGGSQQFLHYLFETVSAFGTVGLSMGITASLTVWGKIVIIALMMIGRVGVLTFSYILVGGGATSGVEYSEENMMIG